MRQILVLKRKKRKVPKSKVYRTVDNLVIANDDLGTCIVEKDETGKIFFNVKGSMDGDKLAQLKQENEKAIDHFRRKGGQGETH